MADQSAADAVPEIQPALIGKLESDFLKQHFAFAGAPVGKRYYVPGSGWVNLDFHSSSLQAQRSERLGSKFFRAQPNARYFPGGADWHDFAERLTADPKPVLTSKDAGVSLVPLFDLASWLYWDVDVADPQDLLGHAKSDLHIHPSLIGTLFDESIPVDAASVSLGASKMDAADVAAALDVVVPPPPAPATIQELVTSIEASLAEAKLQTAPGVVQSIVNSWLSRDIVVLVGAAGTGKSTLAEGVAAALSPYVGEKRTVRVPVGEDWTSAELVGYENLSGDFVARPLAAQVLLSGTPAYPHVVLLEEFNLSKAEHYLSSILQAVESEIPAVSLSGTDHGYLPIDTLIIATCNSPRDDPMGRIPLSAPTIQRMSIIEMPNILRMRWEADGDAGVEAVITSVLRVEARQVAKRQTDGTPTWLDPLRSAAFGPSVSASDLDVSALSALTGLVAAILATPDGSRWMTMRPLRDVAVRLQLTEPAAQAAQLVVVARQKLINLAREIETLNAITTALAGLPGHDELVIAVAAMQTEHGDIVPIV